MLTGEKVPVSTPRRSSSACKARWREIAGGILKQRFEPTPSPEICSFCDYRIICPAAEK